MNQRLRLPEPEGKAPSEDRLVMLCDGIFAIAITLLVLDIKVTPLAPNDPNLQQDLQGNMADILSRIIIYLITFVVIASYWIQHRRIMQYIRRLDSIFIWLTFLFLAFVVFFPVAFNVVIEYGGYPEGVIFYTLELAGCGLSYQALWLYASWRRRLIDSDTPRAMLVSRSIRGLIVPAYFCLSLLFLFIPYFSGNPSAVFFSWFAVPVPFFIYRRILVRRARLSERLDRGAGEDMGKGVAPSVGGE